MSADNGIYILKTTDKFERVKRGTTLLRNRTIGGGEGIEAWRVAHTQAIENFKYFEEKEPHNLGHYMFEVWGNSPIFYSRDEAWRCAEELYDEIMEDEGFVEYSTAEINAGEYNFPGF